MGTIDWLVVLGGPMGVHDEVACTWLRREKLYIREAIFSGRMVLGVCLGAQLIADVLGAGVRGGAYREIGWFPVESDHGAAPLLRGVLPGKIEAFHWHGDTFDIPAGALHTVSGEGCVNQAFQYGDRTLALQFHLETTGMGIADLVRFSGDDIVDAPLVQSPETMAEGYRQYGRRSAAVLDTLLVNMASLPL